MRLRDPSFSFRLWFIVSITGLHRLRDPSFRCAPLRMTGVIERIEERKKGAAEPLPFFFLPTHMGPVLLSASEGTRGLTAAEKQTVKSATMHEYKENGSHR